MSRITTWVPPPSSPALRRKWLFGALPMGEMGEYRFIAHNRQTIGAISPCVEGPAGWRYYIRVPSIAAAVDAVKAGGGAVSMGPHEVPGGDHIIIATDPQGAEFALVGKQ